MKGIRYGAELDVLDFHAFATKAVFLDGCEDSQAAAK